jgi:hypothetical protein
LSGIVPGLPLQADEGSRDGVPDVTAAWIKILAGEFSTGLPLNSFSGALSSSLQVKSGAGMLFGFHAYSHNAGAQFVQLFDTATGQPSTASLVAMWRLTATSQVDVSYIFPGRFFRQGILIANSTTAGTFTAGAADTWFDAQYI